MKKIKSPKFQKRLPLFFTSNEINDLCDLPDQETYEGIRDVAIIELFYSSGLRISELVNLRERDINFHNLILTIIGKGRKKRQVPFTSTAKQWMQKYSLIRSFQKTDIFFLSPEYEPITRFQLYYILKRYINKLSLCEGYSPHTLRHTFATHLLARGANLYSIKEMLGHSSIETTEIYTHVTPDVVRNEFLRGHPRGDDDEN
jgi:site-specific recombinase XerD